MTVILDPALRAIDKDHQIFILHPGDGKRFYLDFKQTSTVFLDVPGASFDTTPDVEDENTKRVLRMARSIAGWHKKGRPISQIPSRKPEDYKVQVEGQKVPKFMREFKTLYVDAKPGDLIVIPGPGYNSEVLFAELVDEFDPTLKIDVRRYGADTIPARKVKFLRTNQSKYEFGRRAIRLMQNRQAIIRVGQDVDRHEFYEHAYGDYAWGDVSGSYMEIREEVVDQKDLTDVLFLTNVYGAMYVALKAGELEKFMALPLHKAVNEYYNRELFGDISIEVHSPGFFGRPIKDNAIAGFVAALTTLASVGVDVRDAQSLEFQNSANDRVSACDMQLQADIRSTMEIVTNAPIWWEDLCKMQKVATENTGLKSKSRIVGDADLVQPDQATSTK